MNDPCAKCSYSPSLTVTRKWRIDIDVPAVSQNALNGRTNRARRYKYKRKREDFLQALSAVTGHIPRATARRRATFVRRYRLGRRAFDNDNLVAGLKGCRDCLTQLGLIRDDTSKWLEAHYAQEPATTEGAQDRVYIVLEDIAEWTLPNGPKDTALEEGSSSQPDRVAGRGKRKPPRKKPIPKPRRSHKNA